VKVIFANIAFLSLIGTGCFEAVGQTAEPHPRPAHFERYLKTEILTGFGLQTSSYKGDKSTRRYLELGMARSIHQLGRHGPVSMGVLLAEEIHLGEKEIYGTKIGMYTHYLLDLGFSAVYYTDFQKGNLKLRPELGVGLGAVRIVGGYNIPTIQNKAFPELTRSDGQLSIQLLLPVKRKPVSTEQPFLKQLFKFNYGDRKNTLGRRRNRGVAIAAPVPATEGIRNRSVDKWI